MIKAMGALRANIFVLGIGGLFAGSPAFGEAGGPCARLLKDPIIQAKSIAIEAEVKLRTVRRATQYIVATSIEDAIIKEALAGIGEINKVLIGEKGRKLFVQLVAEVAFFNADVVFFGAPIKGTDQNQASIEALSNELVQHSSLDAASLQATSLQLVQVFLAQQKAQIQKLSEHLLPQIKEEFTQEIQQFLLADLSAEEREIVYSSRFMNNDIIENFDRLIREVNGREIKMGFTEIKDVPAPKKKLPIGFIRSEEEANSDEEPPAVNKKMIGFL